MGRSGVDGEVLAELRAIRQEIHELAERVGNAATREELGDYVTREVFDAHVEGHRRVVDGWRGWVPIGIASFAVFWNLIGPYVHIGVR